MPVREHLLGPVAQQWSLPVCDHYCGVESRMRKSLDLQAAHIERHGRCLFDVTLDCEDGAPVGGEPEHAAMVAEIALEGVRRVPRARIAARVHAVDHASFQQDVRTIVTRAGTVLSHVMLPKVESVVDVEQAVAAIDAAQAANAAPLPVHVLLESSQAVHQAFAIAAHPRVQSMSFGLMDFVSAHGGAIGAQAMGLQGQFSHPLVLRAKLELAAACHAFGKVPAHCVVTEFTDTVALEQAAHRACAELGYTRMWSIHPDQIEPILRAFAPRQDEVQQASDIIAAAVQAQWAPISYRGRLHDRASYRYYWQVLERASQTGLSLPSDLQALVLAGQGTHPGGTP